MTPEGGVRELLVVLGGERAAEARARLQAAHRVRHQASLRVIVVETAPGDEERVRAIPGVVAATAAELPAAGLEHLDAGESLFIRAWVARMGALRSKRRRGEGAAWDAPGFRPPDADEREPR